MIREWIDVALFKKTPEQVAKEATMKDGFINVVIAALITAVITSILSGIALIVSGAFDSGLIGAGAGIVGAIIMFVASIIMAPIAAVIVLAIGAGIVHLFAKLLGGKGSYSSMIGTIGVINASIAMTYMLVLAIISGLLGIFAIGPIAFVVAMITIPIGLAQFIASIVELYLTIKGIAAVQKFSMLNAALSIIIPMAILLVIAVILLVIAAVIFGAAILTALAGSGITGMFGLM
ncbi:MAG: Yip1 family protein [archaeon]|jgi:hypothetical protein